jgi:hypothetical protein
MHDSRENPPATVTPHSEPTRREDDYDRRSVTRWWTIGQPDDQGRQRQARFRIGYFTGWGFRANVTTVLAHDVQGGVVVEEFTTSLMRLDTVYEQASPRFTRKRLDTNFELALAELARRYDAGEPQVVRHFDAAAPIPRD